MQKGSVALASDLVVRRFPCGCRCRDAVGAVRTGVDGSEEMDGEFSFGDSGGEGSAYQGSNSLPGGGVVAVAGVFVWHVMCDME